MLMFAGWPGAKGWTALTVAACGLLLLNNAIYLDANSVPRFLLEKGEWARQPLWLALFYFHVVGASLGLAAGAPLMFPDWTRRHRDWHRRLGYVYINAVLWMAAPTGLALAATAKGGLWGMLGFALAGLFWWRTTWVGYRAIRFRQWPTHIQAMVRSYAWALSAPAFRLFQVAFYGCGLEDEANYLLSLWLSIAVSVCLAESFSWRFAGRGSALGPVPAATSGVLP